MTDVLLARPADSKGYTHLILADPVGQSQAGETVTIDTPDGESSIVIHGQREFDVLATATKVTFPDGSDWKPTKKS